MCYRTLFLLVDKKIDLSSTSFEEYGSLFVDTKGESYYIIKTVKVKKGKIIKQMKRFIAVVMLTIAILLGAVNMHEEVHAASAENVTSIEYEYSDDTENASEDSTEEEDDEAEVLGAHRDESDRFVICIEIAICVIFAIGLIAAGKSGYEN